MEHSKVGNGIRVMDNLNNLVLVLIRQDGFTNTAQARCFSILVTPFP
jgi:hypothetical protein